MAIATGTASTAVDLLNKLNTFVTANGWTKLRGETDMACASPKAARYWRLLVLDKDSTAHDFYEIDLLEFRSTTGGANVATDGSKYAFSSAASGAGSDLVSGSGVVTSAAIEDDIWWVSYDFTTATTIHEIVMKSGNVLYAPASFYVQWSNDNFSWTTMLFYPQDLTRFVTTGDSFTFTWDTGSGYTDSQHVSASLPRRGGWSQYALGGLPNRYREFCDDVWCWQGPGYDAARRVFVSAMPGFDLGTNDEWIHWSMSTEIDTAATAPSWMAGQVGDTGNTTTDIPVHFMSTTGVTYWFYVSATRVLVVTRSGVDDYSSSYLGFLAAFALPAEYPWPLYMGASYYNWDAGASLADATSGHRDCHDPADGAAFVRDWDNNWSKVYNHDRTVGFTDEWTGNPAAWTWPIHIGVGGLNQWPDNIMGDYANDPQGHWIDRIDPTEQGDLPVWPVLIQVEGLGTVGALEGVYKVPGGGVLAPEATFTIGADTYRVFTTRDHSSGNNYYAVKEV